MGVIMPETEEVDAASAPRVLLKQDGGGNLIGEIDRRSTVTSGIGSCSRIKLACLCGLHRRVIAMDDVDAAPLRVRLQVEPEVHLHQLPWVVIVGQDAGGVAP